MKKQSKLKSRSRYLTRDQAQAILEMLDAEELPEHDSPFKLYFNGKLTSSIGAHPANAKPKSDEETCNNPHSNFAKIGSIRPP